MPAGRGRLRLGRRRRLGSWRTSFSDERDAVEGINPLDVGRAVHEVLEAADFSDIELSRERARRICRRLHVPEEVVLEHLERALESELMQRAARAEVVHRELPLASVASEDDRTVITEGVADLLFQLEGRWVLVDYKSDASILEERLAGYEQQVRAYASMLEGAGVVVDESWILLTSSGEAVSVSL